MSRFRLALATATAGMLLAGTLAADAAAQIKVPFDHYLCYKVTPRLKVTPPPLVLIDQFDEAEKKQENVRPKPATKFCAPVFEKNHEQVLFDPVIHLTRYPFTSKAPSKHVEIFNQFEQVQLKTLAPVELIVPTTKTRTEPPPPPPTGEEFSFEHYKCYTLEKNTFVKKTVTVTDQFGLHTLVVTMRTRLCNPVTKIVNGRTFPIRNPERHLLCYAVKPHTESQPLVFVDNQFGPNELQFGPSKVGAAIELCLPTFKRLLPGAKKARADAR
jgi:hypothetical protein